MLISEISKTYNAPKSVYKNFSKSRIFINSLYRFKYSFSFCMSKMDIRKKLIILKFHIVLEFNIIL